MSRYLGVDGGGTKTAFVLTAGDGTVLARTTTDGAYYLGTEEGIALVGRVLEAGIRRVCAAAGIEPADIDRAFVGLPAYGEVTADLPVLDAAPGATLGHERYSCGNDMVCGWAGSLAGEDGINVIAGTGSMTYGERDGLGHRAGGWGELFGDEGSGYWVAIEGLRAFSRMSDGRLPRGPLHDRMREAVAVEHDIDVIDVVLARWKGDRGRIAALSRAVVAAADDGDAAAVAILNQAAVELVGLVEATRRALGFPTGAPVVVSYSGGMFSVDRLRDRFAALLEQHDPGYDLRMPRLGPAAGAALYAARQDGHPFDEAALARLAAGMAVA